eukprot:TRINITY_DN7572_c2_g1_i1.p1 TRINITY_DN7572_c2_g1~~TRINITY_DN7572_c2_g1_i1.p1  ORF type:complete len:312 (+),score=90.71 TRINITY_DN7572_c2_g1_i1:65-1000(+)
MADVEEAVTAADAEETPEERQHGEGEEGKPRRKRTAEDWAEQYKKVKRTIGWYNHNGDLAGGPIIYKNIKAVIEATDPKETLKILHQLEEKKDSIKNPTNWLLSAVNKVGAELDSKVKKVIAWYNKQDTLASPILYKEVRGPLSYVSVAEQLHILKGLEGKESQIQDPTKWVCAAAQRKAAEQHAAPQSWQPRHQHEGQRGTHEGQRGTWVMVPLKKMPAGAGSFGKGSSKGSWGSGGKSGVDEKVRRTIGWYNHSGLLVQEIRFDEVSSALSQVGQKQALEILKGLETKGPSIRNPSAWIVSACRKLGAQ